MMQVINLSGKERVAVVLERAEKLIQAILAKAFLGELVPTASELARREGRSYEPASALLAKIKLKLEDFKLQRKRKGRETVRNQRQV